MVLVTHHVSIWQTQSWTRTLGWFMLYLCSPHIMAHSPAQRPDILAYKQTSTLNQHRTASLRFDGALNVDITEFQTNLVPYPRILGWICLSFFLKIISWIKRAQPQDLSQRSFGVLLRNSLHAHILRPSDFCGEGVPWAAVRGRDHHVCLRARFHDGEVRSSSWQVHGLLHDVPRTLGKRYS